MNDRNPYQPPASLEADLSSQPKFNRLLASSSIAISCFALLASYGYSGWLTPLWYFQILPCLALATCAMSAIGLGRTGVPGKKTSMLPLMGVGRRPLVATAGWIGLFTISIYGLSTISVVYLWNVIPRILVAVVGGVVAYFLTAKIHGAGRRMMAVANSLAIFQAVTSIADMLSLSTVQ